MKSRDERIRPNAITAGNGSIVAPQPLNSGSGFRCREVLPDRYRIESFLARGGMGEVYRAQDLELGVPVALKTIRPEIAADPAALRNFKQVLTARSVTHSNVCRRSSSARATYAEAFRRISFAHQQLPGTPHTP